MNHKLLIYEPFLQLLPASLKSQLLADLQTLCLLNPTGLLSIAPDDALSAPRSAAEPNSPDLTAVYLTAGAGNALFRAELPA